MSNRGLSRPSGKICCHNSRSMMWCLVAILDVAKLLGWMQCLIASTLYRYNKTLLQMLQLMVDHVMIYGKLVKRMIVMASRQNLLAQQLMQLEVLVVSSDIGGGNTT